MSATNGGQSSTMSLTADRKEAVLLEWTVHLLRRDPVRAWTALAAIAAAALIGYGLFHVWLFAVLGAVLVFSAASEFLLPIRYRLTTRGIYARNGIGRLEMEWHTVRRVLEGEDAVKLSPFAKPCRLDGSRGIVLRLAPAGTPGDRDSVISVIRRSRSQREDAESNGA